MKSIICTFLISLSATIAFCQADPQKITEGFFEKYQTKGPSDALDYLFSTNKWGNESKDQLDDIKAKLNSTTNLLGKYCGHDVLTKKNINDRLILFTFMVRYERQPLRFFFLFYRADRDWAIYDYRYDDHMDDELKESAKLH